MRDLSPQAFDQLRTQLARAAAGVAREKVPRQRAVETAPRPTHAEPDGVGGEAGPPGSS
jgi:hypothetical protein